VDRPFRRRVGTSGVLLRTSNAFSSAIKSGDFGDLVMNCYLFKKVSLRGVRRGENRRPSCKMSTEIFMISNLRREVAETCAHLSYYTAGSGNFLPTVRYNLSVNPEDGTDRLYRPVGRKLLVTFSKLCRNVSKALPLLAA
jgi:hypothetical protein